MSNSMRIEVIRNKSQKCNKNSNNEGKCGKNESPREGKGSKDMFHNVQGTSCSSNGKIVDDDEGKAKSRIKWKNARAAPNEAYQPTYVEQLANIVTHGVWIVPSIVATRELFLRSSSDAQKSSALVYGSTLVFLFVVSTSFHCVFFCRKHRYLVNFLHRCDRAVIYVFIAGSYYPWLTIHTIRGKLAAAMKIYIWVLSVLGIIYQQVFHEKYKTLEIIVYLLIGLVPATLLVLLEPLPATDQLILGGVLYLVGVIFFKLDGVIPFAHAIWHLFVAFAAMTHYFAILNTFYPDNRTISESKVEL